MKGHFEDIRPGMRELDWIGGELALARIRAAMDELEPALAACPFCGSSAALRGVFLYDTPAVIVECPRCKCRTPTQMQKYNYLTGENEPFGPRCAERAAARWNRRAEATA